MSTSRKGTTRKWNPAVLDHAPQPKRPRTQPPIFNPVFAGATSQVPQVAVHVDQPPLVFQVPNTDVTQSDDVGVEGHIYTTPRVKEVDLTPYLVDLPPIRNDDEFDRVEEPQTSRRKTYASDDPLRKWLPERAEFLSELLRQDGRQGGNSSLCGCGHNDAPYFCEDCFCSQYSCQDCVRKEHVKAPFHRIKKWNGHFNEKTSLLVAELEIRIGHPRGRCVLVTTIENFTVLDTTGLHRVKMSFCSCGATSASTNVQLLRARLFPATIDYPHTAATFRLLELVDIVTYESKMSTFEFYQSLARLTDNTKHRPEKNRYPEFARMCREWRHLKLVKRAGRGHHESGVGGTAEGECAVLCPACPQPGKNMAPGWESTPADKQFLHSLFIGLDANFRLKRKDVSDDAADPGLGPGFAYFVEEGAFRAHLAKYSEEKEPKSSCSHHNAVNLASGKPGGKDYAATGLGKVECIRHEMHRPNGACDLQKGERYCNMDYIFYKTLRDLFLLRMIVSYDIACQWVIHLMKHMTGICEDLFIHDSRVQATYLVPKFHLSAHILECRNKYSFNFTPGVARTDGEGVERAWAEINPLATSTREMGPGTRRDMIDAHFGDANWRKTTGLGGSLLKRLEEAGPQMLRHHDNCRGIEETTDVKVLKGWKEEMTAWEKDPTQPNPFGNRIEGMTQAAARRELAEAEALAVASGTSFAQNLEMSPLQFITRGLELETEQRHLKIEHSKLWEHSRDRQRTAYALQDAALQRKIQAWARHQATYMPNAIALREQLASKEGEQDVGRHTFEKALWLPSTIKGQVAYDTRFADIEWQLRVAQAFDALSSMCRGLFLRARLRNFSQLSIRGQTCSTRAQNALDTVQARINMNAEMYRAAQTALDGLSNITQRRLEMVRYPILNDSDIRDLKEIEEDSSAGKTTTAWIWKTGGADQDDKYQMDEMRVEWAKSYARAMRFTEEVELVQEEMNRVLRFLHWQARDWETKAEKEYPKVSNELQEGFQAYAHRQAHIRHQLRQEFERAWKNVDEYVAGLGKSLAKTESAYIRDIRVEKSNAYINVE